MGGGRTGGEGEDARDCTSRFIWVKRRERVARECISRAREILDRVAGRDTIGYQRRVHVDPSIDGGDDPRGRVSLGRCASGPMRLGNAACILPVGGRGDRARWKNERTHSFGRVMEEGRGIPIRCPSFVIFSVSRLRCFHRSPMDPSSSDRFSRFPELAFASVNIIIVVVVTMVVS